MSSPSEILIKAEISNQVSDLGRKQRERAVQLKHMDDEIAALRERWANDVLDQLDLEIDALFNSIYVAASGSRKQLLAMGSPKKSVTLASGEIGWRNTPPKCNVRNGDAVIQSLRDAGLHNLVICTPAIDKEAVLRNPDAISEIKGLTVTTSEQFWCKPLETSTETTKMVAKSARGGKRRTDK